MPIATGLAIGLGVASAAGAIGGGAIAASGAKSAAKTQSSAADAAALLQKQAADESLAFQKQQFDKQQEIAAPFVQAGQGAVSQLSSLLQPGGALTQQWDKTFQAPTGATEQNDPGYQFRLSEGQKALEHSAAARGGLLSGGTGKALERYGQDYASNEYGNVYNRALGEYQQSYNQFQNNQANTYNRLAGLSGAGQVAAGQLNQQAGQNASSVNNILMGSAAQQSQDIQNAAAARGSGYAGSANAWGGALSGAASGLTDSYLLSNLLKSKAINT
jgi:hypothetical protein